MRKSIMRILPGLIQSISQHFRALLNLCIANGSYLRLTHVAVLVQTKMRNLHSFLTQPLSDAEVTSGRLEMVVTHRHCSPRDGFCPNKIGHKYVIGCGLAASTWPLCRYKNLILASG